MSDEEQKDSNVFSLTGDRYAPSEKIAVEDPCAETVACLQDVIEHALSNQIRGVYILGWSPKHQRFVRWCMMPSEENQEAAALRFLGGVEIAKSDLMAIVAGSIIALDEDGNPIA